VAEVTLKAKIGKEKKPNRGEGWHLISEVRGVPDRSSSRGVEAV